MWTYRLSVRNGTYNRYTILYNDRIQPFGDTFFHKRGDVKRDVARAVKQLNVSYAFNRHKEREVIFKRTGKPSIKLRFGPNGLLK